MSANERVKEHMSGLRRCMEPPEEGAIDSLEDVSPLLRHQWVYHPGQLQEYWVKVITKHFTAFNIQVQEGVIITKLASDNDIIMNSKSEIVGTRIGRKKITLKG